MYGYNISYYVDVEYADGDYESDSFGNIYNAEDFVDDCIAEGDYNDNPVTYYKIVKSETSGGMIVDEEIIKEEEFDY